VSVVASRTRSAVIAEARRRRGLSADVVGRLQKRAPAGLDIGAVTPEEIAVSILAEIVQHRRGAKPDAEVAGTALPSGDCLDPICGMTVEIATARDRSEVACQVVYFCCARCKEIFDSSAPG
jgi:xanthine dehydrogenase accessory factor